MNDLAALFHFFTIMISVITTSMSVSYAEGIIAQASIAALNIQPRAHREIVRATILSMALTETAAFLTGGMALILVKAGPMAVDPWLGGIAKLGIALVISLTSGIIGLLSYKPAQAACFALARQPFFGPQIIRLMLTTLTLMQTPSIFGFIIALFIHTKTAFVTTLPEAARLLASGIAIGIGSIGPAIGLAHFSEQACKSLGINRASYRYIFTFTFISEAIIETPIIFSLLVSLILLSSSSIAADTMLQATGFLTAGLCVGIGTIAPGISSGKTAARACKEIALQPNLFPLISRVSMIVQGMLDTHAIYALLISLLLLFYIK